MRALLFLIITFLSIHVYGQNDAYIEAVKAAKQQMATAKSKADWQAIANQFERITAAENSKWEPYYHLAFCQLMVAFQEKGDKIDAVVDLADANIDKALVIAPKESEIYVLKAMSYQARISVSPMSRGKENVEKAAIELSKAEALNAENPRIYFSRGQNTFNTPKFFGGGAKNAKPYFLTAKEKFEKFVPKDVCSPNWGKSNNDEMLSKCE